MEERADKHRMRSDESRKALFRLARLVLDHLRANSPDNEVPQELERVVEFGESGPPLLGAGAMLGPTWDIRFRPRAAARRIAIRTEDLLALPDFEDSLALLHREGGAPGVNLSTLEGERIPSPSFDIAKRPLTERIIANVREYVDKSGSFDLDEERFEDLYIRQRLWESADEADYLLSVPLFGFYAESPPIVFSGACQIDAFSRAEKNVLWHRDSFASFADFDSFARCGFILHVSYRAKLRTVPDEGELAARRTVDRVLLALRLLHAGRVRATAVSKRAVTFEQDGAGQVGNLEDWGDRGLPFDPYSLREAEMEDLRGLFDQLKKAESSPSFGQLKLAIRRFNHVYSRPRPEDQIVDLAIALESSLLFGIEEELKYRLALRGAALLRKHGKPEETAALLRSVYDVRSKLVHEGLSLEEMATHKNHKRSFALVSHHTMPARLMDCVRYTIREFVGALAAGGSVASVVSDLDAHILTSLGA